MNPTVASASALVSACLAGLALVFVWTGSESVHFNWIAMDNDLSAAEMVEKRNPVSVAYSYTDSYGESSGMAAAPELNGDNFVLWLNVSGIRKDTVEDAETPWFDEMDMGAASPMMPPFPSTRFPSMLSQATGVSPDKHGILADGVRGADGAIQNSPTSLALLNAEPIWTTAKRQGMPVLVHDWPFSQEQPSEHAADIFNASFDDSLGDDARLNSLFDAWSSHQGENKIRLAMGSLYDVEKAMRANGSKEEGALEAVTKLDTTLKGFFEKLKAKWPELRKAEGDKLYVILSSAHGMADPEKLINFKELMGEAGEKVDFAINGSVCHVWFKEQDEDFIEEFDKELNARTYWRSFAKDAYPSNWMLGNGGPNAPDRFLILKRGYSFSSGSGSEPVFDPSETGGPFADTGFHIDDVPLVRGTAFYFRLDGGGYMSDAGQVNGEQMHATICKLLKINPATGANTEAIDIP